jgi:hypothetical protein
MLFPRNVLASGPQAWFGAEKGRLKVGKGKGLLSSYKLVGIHEALSA